MFVVMATKPNFNPPEEFKEPGLNFTIEIDTCDTYDSRIDAWIAANKLRNDVLLTEVWIEKL